MKRILTSNEHALLIDISLSFLQYLDELYQKT